MDSFFSLNLLRVLRGLESLSSYQDRSAVIRGAYGLCGFKKRSFNPFGNNIMNGHGPWRNSFLKHRITIKVRLPLHAPRHVNFVSHRQVRQSPLWPVVEGAVRERISRPFCRDSRGIRLMRVLKKSFSKA